MPHLKTNIFLLSAETATNSSPTSMPVADSVMFLALALAYFIIILSSLFGNSILIHIIRTRHYFRSATNYLILNQACADLVITLTMMRDMLGNELFYRKWFPGDWGLQTCRIIVFVNFPSPFCSIWSLAAIAIDRYFAVAQPLKMSIISRHIKAVIIVLWVWSVLCALGMVSMAHLKPVRSGDGYVCITDFLHVKLTIINIISLCVMFLNFLVPLVLMAILYSIVCWRLWSRDTPGDEANHDHRHRQTMKTAKKVTRMMIVVVVLFVLCWFPFHVFVVLASFHRIKLPFAALKFIVWLANSYSSINPFIYFSFNGRFRGEFVLIMRKCFGCFRRCCRTTGRHDV